METFVWFWSLLSGEVALFVSVLSPIELTSFILLVSMLPAIRIWRFLRRRQARRLYFQDETDQDIVNGLQEVIGDMIVACEGVTDVKCRLQDAQDRLPVIMALLNHLQGKVEGDSVSDLGVRIERIRRILRLTRYQLRMMRPDMGSRWISCEMMQTHIDLVLTDLMAIDLTAIKTTLPEALREETTKQGQSTQPYYH